MRLSFFGTVSHRVIAPIILKFGTGMKLDGSTQGNKKVCDVTVITLL